MQDRFAGVVDAETFATLLQRLVVHPAVEPPLGEVGQRLFEMLDERHAESPCHGHVDVILSARQGGQPVEVVRVEFFVEVMCQQGDDPEPDGIGAPAREPFVDAGQGRRRGAAERLHAAGRDVAGRPVVDVGQEAFEGVERLAGRADVSQQDAVQVVFVVVAVGQLRQECSRFGGAAQRACESAQLRNAAAQHPVGVDARREAGRKGCVAGVGQCEKVFGDGFH